MKPYLLFFAFSAVLIGSCKKDNPAPVNHPPVAHAGTAQAIQLPLDSVTLTGTGSSVDTKIVGYLWSEVSGPNVPVIAQEASPSTLVRGLIAGRYTFQFMVIDSLGLTGVDTVSVVVNPSVITTVTLQPSNNPDEAEVANSAPNGPFKNPPELPVQAWTVNGNSLITRIFLKFDMSQIPAKSTIMSAKLSLYSMSVPLNGDFVNAQSGIANAYNISRVVSAWDASTLTWNNQPATSSSNRITVPQSTSAFQDATDIDVTGIVQDMSANGNYGFEMALQNETIYNIRQYVSSSDTNQAKHPKLVITYQQQ